jgi:hypothetical protein
MTAYVPSPAQVVEALASLDVGARRPREVAGWKGNLKHDTEQASMALWVLILVARVDECQACDVLNLPHCLDCRGYMKACPVEDDALKHTVELVVETVQALNRQRARTRR